MKTRHFFTVSQVHRCVARGVTLIELMVTIFILAILMTIATPSFREYQRNSELTSLTNTLLAAVNSARGEAMKYSAYAMVVPGAGADWNTGWRVFVDKNMDKKYKADDDVLLLEQAAPPNYIRIAGTGSAAGSSPSIIFNASGYAGVGSTFSNVTINIQRNDVTGPRYTRRLKISKSGRARVCRPVADSDANCSDGSSGDGS